MPKHKHSKKDFEEDDRHMRRERDSDRERRDRGRNDRDRERDRDRNRSRERSYNNQHQERNSRDRHDDRSRYNEYNKRPDQRFPRGAGSSNFGFRPSLGPPMGGPPGFLPFGGHGHVAVPMGVLPVPVLGNFGPPGILGMPPPFYPGPSRDDRRDRRDDDGSRKRERDHSRGSNPHGRDGWDNKRPRLDSSYRDMQEEQRLIVSHHAPNRIFIEDVNLDPEYAFRLDCAGNMNHLRYSSLNLTNTSRFEPSYRRDDIFGASEEELSKLPFRSVFSRCVRPVGIDDDGNPVDDDGNLLDDDGKPIKQTPEEKARLSETVRKKAPVRKHKPLSAASFISFGKQHASSSKTSDLSKSTIDINSKKPSSIREQVEAYNVELRKNPKNIDLWRKFVKFQDLVFQHEAEELNQSSDDKETKKIKIKRNKKVVAEKKISILDKALESNPKNLDLHLDRLELVYEIYKPRYVLGEWKKLVTVYQQIDAFWNEYLRFSATQLQLYSTSSITATFEKSFHKFRLMLNPNYPSFQRPEKCLLLISDLLFGLSSVLRDSGCTEKAIALHQAQLEMNFNFPDELIPDKSKADWGKICKLFEVFWDAGTLRFGESDAPGWSNFVSSKPKVAKTLLGLPQQTISEWEDSFFDALNSTEKSPVSELPLSQHWLTVESFRSTCYWLPWRENCSDVDSCEDDQRIVLASDVLPFLVVIPDREDSVVSSFDRASAQFRTAVNFLLLLQEDFLPRTQTLDSTLSSFTTVSLAKSKTFFSEIYYWKTFLNLYLPADTESDIVIPDGFEVTDYNNRSCISNHSAPSEPSDADTVSVDPSDIPKMYSEEIMNSENQLYKNNLKNYLKLIRTVVEKSIEHLPPKFASLLAQMYLKFEQRSTYNTSEDSPKSRMKSAKELLQTEKIRNSLPLYGEMALLEYFCSKNKAKASAILVKTINSAVQGFRKENEIDVASNWETLAEITRLYKLLAELQLNENRNLSLHILIALGKNFKDINLDESVAELSKNEMLLARRQFEKVLNVVLPVTDDEPASDLLQWDGDKSVDFLVQNSHLLIEWTSAYALFLYLSADFSEVSELFQKVMKQLSGVAPLTKSNKYDAKVVNVSHIREQLYLMWCKIGILEIAKNPMQNSKFRQILVDALTEFPASPPLLVIFTDVEKQSSIAGKIWRSMTGSIKKESSINSLHWAPLFMALGLARKVDELRHDEEVGLPSFGLGGPAVPPDTIFHKLDAVLTTAEQNPCSRNCPLIWRIHLKLNALRMKKSRNDQTAKGMFYDAIRNCPAVKYLYMDALSYFPDMLKEVQDLMKEKQFVIRLPLEELNVLLEKEEEITEAGNDKVSSRSEESEDDIEEVAVEVDLTKEENDKPSETVVEIIESMSEGEIGEDEETE